MTRVGGVGRGHSCDGMDALGELIDRGDLDELIRLVDRLADAHEWAELLELAARCRRAHERGRQLWPAAEHAWYRVALGGPAALACRAVTDADGRFGIGPLTEVIASTHDWWSLAPHLEAGPLATTIAHERVIRGDDLSAEQTRHPSIDLPLVLQSWEPAYPVATYSDYSLEPGSPPSVGSLALLDIGGAVPVVAADDPGVDALLDVVRSWTSQSNGHARAVAVEGGGGDAIGALGARRARAVAISPADALATMAWCAASGGAKGRRRGMAAGRFDAWWAAAALAALDWPPDPDELGDAIAALRWCIWDRDEPATGWDLRLAIEDPDAEMAWAIDAVDHA